MFVDVQNGFYNALTEALGLSRDTFQILQPSPPLLANNDSVLWNYFNNIPPRSLTQNYVASGLNQFFSDYKGMISALQSVPDNVQQDIGSANYANWQQYLQSISPRPAANQIPDLFFNWAIFEAPDVADVGASDYASLLLDPISSAGLALQPYRNAPPDWSLGYSQLVQLLTFAPAVSFSFSSSTMSVDVSTTWTSGEDSGFFGLWGGSSSSSSQSVAFASSNISVNGSFDHVLTFQDTPGNWYSSAATGAAFGNQGSPPWRTGNAINWNNTFDPQNGNMTRFMVSLIVVDNMNIVVTSDATFSASDQQTIQDNSSGGLWPFYTSSSGSGASTFASFDDNGNMTVQISTVPGVPVVLGGNVLSVDRAVGHAVRGAQLAREAKIA